MQEFWESKKVLVTGAGGFIGSHLTETLVNAGASVRALVHYNSRGDWGLLKMLPDPIVNEVEVVTGDLRDLSGVIPLMEGVEYIFHLGALIAIPYSYTQPGEVIATNVMGTFNVLQAARATEVKRIVHTSTSEVYGTALRVPIDEDHPLQGQSPYSASKIGADKIAESFYRSFDVPVATVRPFNTYGPRQSTRAVIPTIITQALSQDVVRLGNLDATRDLTFVSDTVSGFLKMAETPGVEGETLNLGTGQEISIGALADEIISLVNRNVKIEIDPSRLRPEKSEVQRLLSDNSRAKARINWQPEISLRAGLAKTIDWVADHLDLFRPEAYQL